LNNIYFDDDQDSRIYARSDDSLIIRLGGAVALDMQPDKIYSYKDFLTNSTDHSLGSNRWLWGGLHIYDSVKIYDSALNPPHGWMYNDDDSLMFGDNANPSGVSLSTLVSGAGGGGYWTRNAGATYLAPTNSGDDIRLSSGEMIQFGGSDNVLYEPNDDQLLMYMDRPEWYFDSTAIFPAQDGSNDIGGVGSYIDTVFANVYMRNGVELTGGASSDSTYATVQTDSLKTFDGDSAVAVADLYNVSNDTGSIGDYVRELADTVLLWSWMVPDSALFEQSTFVAYFYHSGPDTMYVTSTRVGTLDATNTNFTFNVQHLAELDDLPETLFTTAPTVTGTEVDAAGVVDTPDNDVSIPPGRWIGLTIDSETSVPARGASFNFYGYEY